VTTPQDAIPSTDLATLLRVAGLELSEEQMAALEPIVRRAFTQAEALRELPLTSYEPASIFTPTLRPREDNA
jgi:hypothetical protein